MKKEEKKRRFKVAFLVIGIILASFAIWTWGYAIGWGDALKAYDITSIDEDFLFRCNEYYDGQKYGEERCETRLINITGNYCNGELVCQNQLRTS